MTRNFVMAGALVAALGAIPVVAHQQGQQGQAVGRAMRGDGPGGSGGPGRGGRGGPGGPNLIGAASRLDLSDAQRDQLKALMADERKDDRGVKVRETEQKLHAAVLADTPDTAAIEGLKAVLNSAHAAELDRRISTMQKVAQILTPAQRQQLLNLQPEGRGRGR
jgi:Spy/CpxP family protein refolding chaperone